MAKIIEVTLSAMEEASKNIKNYTEKFKEEAELVYSAAQQLRDGWTGDAYDTFVDNMEQLHRWMLELGQVLDTYSAELNTAKGEYGEADITSARNFQ